MSPLDFIARSSLVWRRSDTTWDTCVEVGAVDPVRLGASTRDPYVHVEDGAKIAASELTRPFENNPTERVPNLPREKGFALVNHEGSPGEVATSYDLERRLATASMYYEIQRVGQVTRICYWLFFGSSSPPANALEAIAWRTAERIGDWIGDLGESFVPERRRNAIGPEMDLPDAWGLVTRRHAHEGDWEGITLELAKDYSLGRIHFRAHHGGHFTAAKTLPTGRITVYCSLGSHACFESPSSPNNRDGDEIPSEGVVWDPLAHDGLLVDATEQPWYGFGGAWGDPGLDHPVHVDIFRRDLAGPLGPSRYKRIWPADDRH